MLTLKEISKQTGIQLDFLRKCIKILKVEFKSFQDRGLNNAILLDENALGIIEKIKTLKDKNLSISAIVRIIKNDLQTEHKSKEITTKPDLNDKLHNEEKARLKAELACLEAEKQTIQNRYDRLQKDIFLLTDGKGYEIEDIIKKREKENLIKGEKKALLENLNSLRFWHIKRRKKIISHLVDLEN